MFKSNRWYKSQRNHNYNKCHDLITIITICWRNGRVARMTSSINRYVINSLSQLKNYRLRCAGTSLNLGYSGLTRNCRRTICLSSFFLFSLTRAILQIPIDSGWILFILFAKAIIVALFFFFFFLTHAIRDLFFLFFFHNQAIRGIHLFLI